MTTLVWFKRDLRVTDHAALRRAAEGGGPVLPLYIVEPEYWRLPDTSERQYLFLADTLADLRERLAALGAPLVVRTGNAVAVLSDLAQAHGVTRILAHEETGNLWSFDRDRRVRRWAHEAGIPVEEFPHSGVVRRLASRDGWAAHRDRVVFGEALPAPRALEGIAGLDPGAIPLPRELGIAPDGCRERQAGGRSLAEACLHSFLHERGRDYRRDMSSPVAGERSCSRLSPHLALGTVTVREVAHATSERQRAVRGTRDGWAGSFRSFQSRLAWRDHFIQKLEDEPAIERRCLHPDYEGLRPSEPDSSRLSAWAAGETGMPFVDACMRYLRATGWLNFRMRSMLVSVASYHLWLDWRATGPHLAGMFTDYEPGIHWSQMQMQSGTTGMNTVRIYNPVKQGRDQDPSGAFTRRWVPELAEVPDRFLQEPWLWEGAGRLRYPPPVVDVTADARAAREAVWAVRRGEAFRAEAARIVEKHASRKDRAGRFVNDRERSRRGDGSQMSFDL